MKVKVKGSSYLKDILNNNATTIDNKYFYLPVWFEKIIGTNEFIVHYTEKMPKELVTAIKNIREMSPIIPSHLDIHQTIPDYNVNYMVEMDMDGDIIIRVEDGGIANIRYNEENFVTDYYHTRDKNILPDWQKLAEGKISSKDWSEDITDVSEEMVKDALNWLYMSTEKVIFRKVEKENFKFK